MRLIAAVIAGGCLLTLIHGCGEDGIGDLPPVAEVLAVVHMDWPWCVVQPPPVRSDFEVCPISEIGDRIEPERVCWLLVGLKDWMVNPPSGHPDQLEPGDWDRIRSMIVCRWGIPRASSDEVRRVLHIEADVPERPRLYWAELEDEAFPRMRFGVVHR